MAMTSCVTAAQRIVLQFLWLLSPMEAKAYSSPVGERVTAVEYEQSLSPQRSLRVLPDIPVDPKI